MDYYNIPSQPKKKIYRNSLPAGPPAAYTLLREFRYGCNAAERMVKMDKDMKAKVDELMKNLGTRELSLEEMDKVSGGWETLRAVNGQYYTGAQIGDLAYNMVDAFGWDIAGESICTMFGVSPNEARNIKRGDITDKDRMDILLAKIAQIMDRLEESGHSY